MRARQGWKAAEPWARPTTRGGHRARNRPPPPIPGSSFPSACHKPRPLTSPPAPLRIRRGESSEELFQGPRAERSRAGCASDEGALAVPGLPGIHHLSPSRPREPPTAMDSPNGRAAQAAAKPPTPEAGRRRAMDSHNLFGRPGVRGGMRRCGVIGELL